LLTLPPLPEWLPFSGAGSGLIDDGIYGPLTEVVPKWVASVLAGMEKASGD
jgi:hypothetical protein